MVCKKCGTKNSNHAKFCSKCGNRLVPEVEATLEAVQSSDDAKNTEEKTDRQQIVDAPKKDDLWGKILFKLKNAVSNFWNKLPSFGKFALISISVFALLFIIASFTNITPAKIVSAFQIILIASAWIIRYSKLPDKKKKLNVLLVALAFVLLIPYFGILRSESAHNIKKDTKTTEITQPSMTFDEYLEYSSSMMPTVSQPASVEDYSEPTFVEDFTELPVIETFSEATVIETSTEPTEIEDITKPTKPTGKTYSVTLDIERVPNLLFSKYAIDVFVDGNKVGTVYNGETDSFNMDLTEGTHTLKITKVNDSSISNSVDFIVNEPVLRTYSASCDSLEIRITEGYVESMRPLTEDEAKLPKNISDYIGKNYNDVITELSTAGFTNITATYQRDLEESQQSKSGDIFEISIDGKTECPRGSILMKTVPIAIRYHFPVMTLEEIRALIDGKVGTPAADIIASFNESGYTVKCYIAGEETENFDTDNYIFESGWLIPEDKIANLSFTTEETIAMKATLEATFPEENARRAVIVALTNCQATDVFRADGKTYDKSKFHSYSDISGFFLKLFADGYWTPVNENTWHVNGIECIISGMGTHLKASADVSYDGKTYTITNVKKSIAFKEQIDEYFKNKQNYEELEYSRENPFLSVSPKQIQADRDATAEKEMLNRTTPTAERQSWINNQFSAWNGSHKKLEGLIKKNLNDEKSYKHIDTTYIDIFNADLQNQVNDILKQAKVSYRAEIGDLLVMTEFSAKNSFNATVKNTAYGLVSYGDNTVRLICIS